MAVAWRNGCALVQAEAGSEGWRLARVECGSASVDSIRLAERVIRSAEAVSSRPLEHGGHLVRVSAACRLAVEECASRLEETRSESLEALRAIGTIWELCEVATLDEGSRRSARLATWLRCYGVDWATEDDEYVSLVSHLRRLRAEGSGAPESWRPTPDSSSRQRRRPEASSPFWQLTFRLLLRGRCKEAWSVLETHSTMASRHLRDDWAKVESLLRDAPQPPSQTTSSVRFEAAWLTKGDDVPIPSAEDQNEKEAASEEALTFANYEESKRRWKRRCARLRAQLSTLSAAVPPLRLVFGLLDEGPDFQAARDEAFFGPDQLQWEERLLATLLYEKRAWTDVDLVAWLREDAADRSHSSSKGEDLMSTARRELLVACLGGDALAAVKAVYEVGTDLACAACAFGLARLTQAAGKLGGPPPGNKRRQLLSDGDALVGSLGRDLADRLGATAAIESPWRLAIRVIEAARPCATHAKKTEDQTFASAVVSTLRRATVTSDADAVHLGRTCLRYGLDKEARAAVASRGAYYAATQGPEALRKAAFWFARADLCVSSSSPPPFADDAHAERLCASVADALRLSLARFVAGGDPNDCRSRLAEARAVVAGLEDGAAEAAIAKGREAAFLRRYTVTAAALLDSSHSGNDQAQQLAALRSASRGLADLLLDAPPPRRDFLPHLLVLVFALLRQTTQSDPRGLKNAGFSSRAVLGIMHRLVECQNAALDYTSGLDDTAFLADLRLALATALAQAYIAENKHGGDHHHEEVQKIIVAPPRVSPTPTPAFSLAASDLLGVGPDSL